MQRLERGRERVGDSGATLFHRMIFCISMLCFPSAALSEPEDFTYKQLVELIDQRQIKSIEALLPLLPEDHRINYALMHKSRSTQLADPMNPRVIMFGSTGSLIVAFNGKPGVRGFQNLEIIQFNETDQAFEFYEVEFPGEAPTQEVHFSAKNPTKCLNCHGRDPRPNWDQYPEWPGAYGEHDDFLSPEEWQPLKEFLEASPQHGRYQHLLRREGSERSPFLDQTKGDIAFRPNLRLMTLIGGLNARRLTRRLYEEPRFAFVQYLYAWAGMDCTEQNTQINLTAELRSIFGDQAVLPLKWEPVPTASNLFNFIARAAGIEAFDWRPTFHPLTRPVPGRSPHPYSFSMGIGVDTLAKAVTSQVVRRILDAHTELNGLFEEYNPYGDVVDATTDTLKLARAMNRSLSLLSRARSSATTCDRLMGLYRNALPPQ